MASGCGDVAAQEGQRKGGAPWGRTRRRVGVKTAAGLAGFKIYTKTGDAGQSSLYNGERRAKTDAVFRALGDVDELNSAVGVACAALDGDDSWAEAAVPLPTQLMETQSRLLDVGSAVATPADTSSERKVAVTAFDPEATGKLETWIDEMTAALPPLKEFILPGGGMASAQLHVARTVCRRAERAVVELRERDAVDPVVCTYLNRLSDYLFTAARYAAKVAEKPETKYKKAR